MWVPRRPQCHHRAHCKGEVERGGTPRWEPEMGVHSLGTPGALPGRPRGKVAPLTPRLGPSVPAVASGLRSGCCSPQPCYRPSPTVGTGSPRSRVLGGLHELPRTLVVVWGHLGGARGLGLLDKCLSRPLALSPSFWVDLTTERLAGGTRARTTGGPRRCAITSPASGCLMGSWSSRFCPV